MLEGTIIISCSMALRVFYYYIFAALFQDDAGHMEDESTDYVDIPIKVVTQAENVALQ